MLFRRLRQFGQVARDGSIAGAAASLHIAQPALSRQMRALEAEVGAELLVRERRGVQLTAAGRALFAELPVLFEALETAVRRTADAHTGTTGLVRLGVGRMALDSVRVSRAIAHARRTYPGISVDVTEVASLDQARALRGREMDVAIGLADFEGDALVRREVLYEEPIDAAMLAAGHPLAMRPRVDVKDLRDLRYIGLRRPLHGGYPRMEEALRKAGIHLTLEEHETPESVYALVAAGYGWSMASRGLHVHPPAGCVIVPLTGMAFTLPVSIRWRGNDRSRAVLNVVHAIRAACRDEQSATAPRERRTEPRLARALGAPGIELAHVRAFVAAAEEGTLSGAAFRLRLTQSGVSRRVDALERAVGCRLLERATFGVTVTNAGEEMRKCSEEILRRVEHAVARARQAAGGIVGTCRLGALPPELTGNLQVIALREIHERHPRVRIEVIEMLPEEQVRALMDGRIDVALGGAFPGMPLPAELASVELIEDVIDGVLVAEGHQHASRAWITANDLQAMPFLFVDRARARKVYDQVMRAMDGLGLKRGVQATHGSPRAVWRSLAGGDGWTIATRAQRARPPAGLVGVPLEGLSIPWGISLVWRRSESDTTVRQVLEVFRTTRNPEMAVVVATVRSKPRELAQTD